MFAIKGRCREIIIQAVDPEAVEAINGTAAPLPDIADQIVKLPLGKVIYRTRRSPMLQIDIARCHWPIRLIARQGIAQQIPLGLTGKLDGESGLRGLPAAESRRLQLIDLHRPIPGHGNLLCHQPQLHGARARLPHPEGGLTRLGIAAPTPALITPPAGLLIAPRAHKLQIFTIAHQHAAGRKGGDLDLALSKLVVPAIGQIRIRLTQTHSGSIHRQQSIARYQLRLFAPMRTDGPGRLRPHPVDRQLANEHRRGFQMNTLMFYPHQDHPGRRVPCNGQRQRHGADQLTHPLPYQGPVRPQPRDIRPRIVAFIQIIPAHLVNPDGHHTFNLGIDALVDDLSGHQLVDKEGGGMTKVEDQRMA